MFETPVTRRFGLRTPILNAGMAMIARPALAAAVCEAGGLGTIGCDVNPPEGLRALVRETRALTRRPFGVDLIGDFTTEAHIDVLVDERVALVIFFWTTPPADWVRQLQAAGSAVWMQVGTVAEAREAVAHGVDGLVVQGAEAGGHNRAEASTMTLFPRIRRLFPTLPMAAAGGIVDGATMAAALMLGADAVWCGSRFLASAEANAHAGYQRRVVEADVGDTVITTRFGPEWPDQPMRVLLRPELQAVLEGQSASYDGSLVAMIGSVGIGGARVPLPPFSAILPMRDFEGDIDRACLTMGQSAGNIDAVRPAAEIVHRMDAEARQALARIVPPLARAA
jgi:NAD(P)H-dependent flavin oxidoreductase YrpB (nitropropane dioxygenase family)